MTAKPNEVLKVALAWFISVQGSLVGLWMFAGSDAISLGKYSGAAGAYVAAGINLILLIAGWRKFR